MSQRGVVLRLLRERGKEGVSAHELVYSFGITRSAAIVHDLRHDEGMNIVTLEEGTLENGGKRLARYVLKPGQPPPEPRPAAVQMTFEPPPAPVKVTFPCGCVRAEDGRAWESRCASHGG